MSGHSKWSTIKRKKAAIDAKRGQLFTKILREVTVAARLGGGDPDANPRLRAAVQDARSSNVPKEKLERAIQKGTGALEGVAYDEVSYEGYGPGGVAVLVETLTDNRNRTVSEIRHVFSKFGGNLGENGCVGWMFDQRGYFAIDPETMDEDVFMEMAFDLGAEDLATENGAYEIFTAPSDYNAIKQALADKEVEVTTGQLAMIPQNSMEVEPKKLGPLLRMLESLEDLDDVQNVWSNFDADEDALAAQ